MAEMDQLMLAHGGKMPPDLSKMVSMSSIPYITELKPQKPDDSKKTKNIRVILRFRPPNRVEKEEQKKQKLRDYPPNINGNALTLTTITDKNSSQTKRGKHTSVLDHIFNSETRQKAVFKVVGKPLIDTALGGFNATLFAYGQTGSGKTYSMFGANDDGSGTDVEPMGLIPRSFVYLFKQLELRCTNQDIQNYVVTMQTLQIYNKRLLDLLNPNSKTKLEIKTDFTNDSIFVKHLRLTPITSAREALAVLIESSKNRIVAGHKLNAHSSRSHMLVLLKINQIKIDGSSMKSSINFGDLAGSENISKAHGKSLKGKNEQERAMDDTRRKEGIAINASLSALTRCINKLVKGEHPGYRDSPLTHVLQDSLGGNSKTTLLVCASPHIYNRSETIRTLRFAATAKEVKNKAKVNQTLSVKALQKRIKELTAENAQLKSEVAIAVGTIRNAGRKTPGNNAEAWTPKDPQLFAQYSSKPARTNPAQYSTLSYQMTAQLLRKDTFGHALKTRPSVATPAESISEDSFLKSPSDVITPDGVFADVLTTEEQFCAESEEYMLQIATLNEQLQKEVQHSTELQEKMERQQLELDNSEGTIHHLRDENQDKAVKIYNAEQEIATLQNELQITTFVLEHFEKTFPNHKPPEYEEKLHVSHERVCSNVGLHVPRDSLSKMDTMDIQVETLEKYLLSLGSTQTDLSEFSEKLQANVNAVPEIRAEFTEKYERCVVFYDEMRRNAQNVQSKICSMQFILEDLTQKYDEDREKIGVDRISVSDDDEATIVKYVSLDDVKDGDKQYIEDAIVESQTVCCSNLLYCGCKASDPTEVVYYYMSKVIQFRILRVFGYCIQLVMLMFQFIIHWIFE